MEQFSLDKWLQDKSLKVVTRDGREVDIYYSPTSRIPLIGATTSDNEIHQYTKDGFQCDTFNQAKNDLFFADEEELTREQEIEQQSFVYYETCSDEDIAKSKGFIEGAKWADQNPRKGLWDNQKVCNILRNKMDSNWFYEKMERADYDSIIEDLRKAMEE